ncbi:Uncharacterised protein [Bordetella pertussis]|nr:Uncharacterised protein [Bordetella pertussis]
MFPSAAAADQCGQAGFELLQHERLGQEVVGALVQGTHSFGQRIARGQDQDWRTVVAGADAGQQGMAVHAGQAEVQDDGIELFHGQAAFGQQAVIGPFDHEPGMAGKAAR